MHHACHRAIWLIDIVCDQFVGRRRSSFAPKENPKCWERPRSNTRSSHSSQHQIGWKEQGFTKRKCFDHKFLSRENFQIFPISNWKTSNLSTQWEWSIILMYWARERMSVKSMTASLRWLIASVHFIILHLSSPSDTMCADVEKFV